MIQEQFFYGALGIYLKWLCIPPLNFNDDYSLRLFIPRKFRNLEDYLYVFTCGLDVWTPNIVTGDLEFIHLSAYRPIGLFQLYGIFLDFHLCAEEQRIPLCPVSYSPVQRWYFRDLL